MGNSLSSVAGGGAPFRKEIEQLVVPIVCFTAIVLMHARYLRMWLQPSEWADPTAVVEVERVHNLRTFFVGIRTRWVLENHGRTQIAVQTLRDMISTTTAIASAAMAFVSIFVGLSKGTNLLTCDPEDGANPCNTFEERLKFTRFTLCVFNFFVIFMNMLLATRYAMNASFMLNTKTVDGKPLSQMLTVHVLARASWHYTLGIRGFFLAAPLVAWLFGSWLLLGTTCFYLVAVWLMEEEFLLGDDIFQPLPSALSASSLAQLDEAERQRQQQRRLSLSPPSPGPAGAATGEKVPVLETV